MFIKNKTIIIITIVFTIFLVNPGICNEKPLNVIFMIGDGFGPAAATMARHVNRIKFNMSHLHLDNYLVGTVSTNSADSLVTDSAAGATAFATGFKSYNGAVSVDTAKKPLGTLFEAAQEVGIHTGVVVTTRISDATPACFFAHATSRIYESFINSQLLEKNLTVALGGGNQFFNDAIYNNATQQNYHIVHNRKDLLKVKDGKILGVFSNYNLPYELDRINQKIDSPTLNEMTTKALELINQNNKNGFLLMVEGSQIDIAAHSNDAFGQVWETLQFDNTFKTVIDFAEKDGNTIVIVTADHETGGITLGLQKDKKVYPNYEWHPEILLRFRASSTFMSNRLFNNTLYPNLTETNITKLVNSYVTNLNITFAKDEMDLLLYFSKIRNEISFEQFLGQCLSKRADVAFTTAGHSGIDVNLYYHYSGDDESLKHDHIHANVENIDVANFIAKSLKLDLQAQTKKYSNFNPQP